jgi:hypothetical protein
MSNKTLATLYFTEVLTRGTSYLPIYAFRNHYSHSNAVLEMLNCLDFKKIQFIFKPFLGVVSVAFFAPFATPLSAVFNITNRPHAPMAVGCELLFAPMEAWYRNTVME